MAEVGCEVFFLVDRLGARSEVESLRRLGEGLARFGHDCNVLCSSAPADHGLDDLVECPGLGRRWQIPWAIRGLELGDEPVKARIMHVRSSDLAEAALAIAERWKIPHLFELEEFPRRDLKLRLSRAWCRGLIVPNRELTEALVRDFGIPGEIIHEADLGLEEPEGPPPDLDRNAGRLPVVGAAGKLVADSGFVTFLNAARKVVDQGFDAEFLIAGHGDDEGDLRRKAERLKIAERLTFADDLPLGLSFWPILDVYCQTSISPTLGRPLRTAMACGVPSIASDVEGLRSLVRAGENGLIVPPGDSSALALAIVDLLGDRPRAAKLGQAARLAVARNNDPDRAAARLDRLYRDVVGPEPSHQASGLASRTLGPDDPGRREADADDERSFPRISRGFGTTNDRS